jgi:hypothetical protein
MKRAVGANGVASVEASNVGEGAYLLLQRLGLTSLLMRARLRGLREQRHDRVHILRRSRHPSARAKRLPFNQRGRHLGLVTLAHHVKAVVVPLYDFVMWELHMMVTALSIKGLLTATCSDCKRRPPTGVSYQLAGRVGGWRCRSSSCSWSWKSQLALDLVPQVSGGVGGGGACWRCCWSWWWRWCWRAELCAYRYDQFTSC